jgi:hypothetical protein
MAKASAITETAWKGPVQIVPLGWGADRYIRRAVRPLLLSSTGFPECVASHIAGSTCFRREKSAPLGNWSKVSSGTSCSLDHVFVSQASPSVPRHPTTPLRPAAYSRLAVATQ